MCMYEIKKKNAISGIKIRKFINMSVKPDIIVL